MEGVGVRENPHPKEVRMNLTGLQAKVLAAFLARGVPVRFVLDEDGMDALAADGEGLFLDSGGKIGGYKNGPWKLAHVGNGDFLLVTEGERPDWLPIAR
jgi:hypothetical protein